MPVVELDSFTLSFITNAIFNSYYDDILNNASDPAGDPEAGAGNVTVKVPFEHEKSAVKSKTTTNKSEAGVPVFL